MRHLNYDDLNTISVIPVKTGIQVLFFDQPQLDSRLRGNDGELLKVPPCGTHNHYALTAGDRPYKKAVPAELALDLMATECWAGKIDPKLFKVFVDGRVWATHEN